MSDSPRSKKTTDAATVVKPRKKVQNSLPQWKVILVNDEVNQATKVAHSIVKLTPLAMEEAINKTKEAHKTGRALLLTTHKELAELYQEQFQACHPPITIDIEPEEKQ